MTLRTIVVDGLTVETTDAGAAAIEKLQADKTTLQTGATDAKTAHDTAMTEKQATHNTAMAVRDTELATHDAEIKKLKDDADIGKRVAARSEVVAKASALVKDADLKGLSDLEINTKTVQTVNSRAFTRQ